MGRDAQKSAIEKRKFTIGILKPLKKKGDRAGRRRSSAGLSYGLNNGKGN